MQAHHQNAMPFGKHKGKPLGEVPTAYLSWLLHSCKLPVGLRIAATEELNRRGIDSPALPLPRIFARRACGLADSYALFWQEDRTGRRRIRAECGRCRRYLTFLPAREPFIAVADANASATPILDALTQLDDLGIELTSDGKAVWLTGDDWRRVPPGLYATIRQCSNQLAKMIGNTVRN